MITKEQIYNYKEWFLRLKTLIKSYKSIDKEYWNKKYGIFIKEDIFLRRNLNGKTNKHIIKLENILINL